MLENVITKGMEKEMASHASIFGLENSMDRESLVGYNPWDCEQSNTIYLSFFQSDPI